MPNLFSIIRNSKLWDEVVKDPACWVNSRIAPQSYYNAEQEYLNSECADFSTMVICMYERADTPPGKIKLYQEWISLYMFGTVLTDEEMQYRQKLAKRLNK